MNNKTITVVTSMSLQVKFKNVKEEDPLNNKGSAKLKP